MLSLSSPLTTSPHEIKKAHTSFFEIKFGADSCAILVAEKYVSFSVEIERQEEESFVVPFLVTMDKYESNILNTSTQCKNSPFPKCQTNCGHRSSAIASEISTSSSRVELPALLFPALEVFVEYDNIFSINADIRGDYTVFAFETKRERERERETVSAPQTDTRDRDRRDATCLERERERE